MALMFKIQHSPCPWQCEIEKKSGNTKFISIKAKVDAQLTTLEAKDGFGFYYTSFFHLDIILPSQFKLFSPHCSSTPLHLYTCIKKNIKDH
jgi:hypothetical protein